MYSRIAHSRFFCDIKKWCFLVNSIFIQEIIISDRVLWKGRENIMPEFGSPFAGIKTDRNVTKAELVRAIRFMIAAEYEAVQLYMQLAESTTDKLAREVLTDIADEERVHAGEFLRLLHQLAPDEEKFYKEGAEEVNEMIEKLKQK